MHEKLTAEQVADVFKEAPGLADKYALPEMGVGDAIRFEGESTYSDVYRAIAGWFRARGMKASGRTVGDSLYIVRVK